jgi:2-polyprenyl-3-methyl-5-hydroxy-6-metoxy-1,4-benzoquinol methylase
MLPEISNKLLAYLEIKNNCIVCDNNEFTSWAKEGYLEALKCKQCGMISVNPHFSEKGLDYFYNNYFENRLNFVDLKDKRKEMYLLDRDWINKYITAGKVLDIGCGGGEFLGTFSDQWEKCGIDLTDDALEHARIEYGISTYKGKIWETDVGYNYDLVMLRGVIEHFRDPITVLKKAVEVLKPGGYLYLTATPAGDSFAFYVYREKWHLFTPLEHIHFFTVELLTRVLTDMEMNFV